MAKYRNGEGDPKKPAVSKMSTSILRSMLPLPFPVAQAVASSITGDSALGLDEAPGSMKDEVALSVINARKRTGKNRGGTEYIDYGEAIDKDINNLGVSLPNAVVSSIKSPDFRAATTFGRVSYNYNPNTDTYEVYDSYDFSKIKGRTGTAYGKMRDFLGEVGPEESGPKLIGTFKGSDYQDTKGSNDYQHVKRFPEEVKKTMGAFPMGTSKFEQGGMVKKYRKGGKSRVNEAGNYTKPGMRKRLFESIKAGGKGGRPGQWSARKAQMLAKQYKAKGGGYK